MKLALNFRDLATKGLPFKKQRLKGLIILGKDF